MVFNDLRQESVHAVHLTGSFEHLVRSEEHNGGCHVQRHQGRRAQEKVVHSHHGAVLVQRVAKPGEEPRQGKQSASLRPAQNTIIKIVGLSLKRRLSLQFEI